MISEKYIITCNILPVIVITFDSTKFQVLHLR